MVRTVRAIYGEMLTAGTRYAESTVFKDDAAPEGTGGSSPWIALEQAGTGFRVAAQTLRPTESGQVVGPRTLRSAVPLWLDLGLAVELLSSSGRACQFRARALPRSG